jgi:hypothetical protein
VRHKLGNVKYLTPTLINPHVHNKSETFDDTFYCSTKYSSICTMDCDVHFNVESKINVRLYNKNIITTFTNLNVYNKSKTYDNTFLKMHDRHDVSFDA